MRGQEEMEDMKISRTEMSCLNLQTASAVVAGQRERHKSKQKRRTNLKVE